MNDRSRKTFVTPSLSSKLPPLRSLVAFEAAARNLSFTMAGEELRVSREAVSRHIRLLEQHLGVALFERRHRSVALTPEGTRFNRVVRESLENIAYGAGAAKSEIPKRKITVSATIAIASFWLTPRLARFRAAHPQVEIHIAISDEPRDLVPDEIDIGLRYGDGNWSGVESTKLFDVVSFPVCSPQYLENAPCLRTPKDLLQHTLINLDGPPHAAEDWLWWLKEQNVTTPETVNILGLDSYDSVIQLAVAGDGIALGFSGLATDFLADGRLIRPIDATVTPNRSVYLVAPTTGPSNPIVQNFIDWILTEVSGEDY